MDLLGGDKMNSFSFLDAVRFRLATQQEDTSAKVQVFIGVFAGVVLRWIYSVAVNVIKNQAPWCFGSLTSILIRLAVALVVTFFVFSGYWQKVRDQPASMRFWNALAYGITMDVIVSSWLPAAIC
jgi:phosphotransferase system  glucose/maltose/N-acetylglucosamine-specific IIC component